MKKKEPWRVIVFLISVAYIICLLHSKNTVADMSGLIITNIMVTGTKVAIIFVAFRGIKLLSKTFKHNRKEDKDNEYKM